MTHDEITEILNKRITNIPRAAKMLGVDYSRIKAALQGDNLQLGTLLPIAAYAGLEVDIEATIDILRRTMRKENENTVDLAKKSGVTYETLRKMLNGKSVTLYTILDALGVYNLELVVYKFNGQYKADKTQVSVEVFNKMTAAAVENAINEKLGQGFNIQHSHLNLSLTGRIDGVCVFIREGEK